MLPMVMWAAAPVEVELGAGVVPDAAADADVGTAPDDAVAADPESSLAVAEATMDE